MSLSIFNQNTQNTLATKTMASGFKQVALLSRKAYGLKYELKGQALKKAHSLYIAEKTNDMSGDLAKALSSGAVRAVKGTQTKKGARIEIVRSEEIYNAKSFDNGVVEAKEKDKKLKASEALLKKQWAKMRELGMTSEEIEKLIAS